MDNCCSLIRCRSVCVTFMYGATVLPSVLFPVVIRTGEWFADLILALRRRRCEAFVMTHFVTVQLRGLGATVDFGVEEHMWSNFVALDQDIITDNRTRFPCYVEFARRALGRSETTCQAAAGSSAGGKTAQGALER